MPWVLYLQTGDQAILTESWDALVHYMEYLQAHERGQIRLLRPATEIMETGSLFREPVSR